MTIITKPISEKKSGKLLIPLDSNEVNETVAKDDVEAQSPASGVRMVILPARIRRVSTTTTLCLLLTALVVVGIGIVGGTYLYQQYIRSQLRFKGWCSIPFSDNGKSAMFISPNFDENSELDDAEQLKLSDSFQELFEIDLESRNEKIDVPDFRNGRSGRFIHDFNTNMTGIVDISGRRCFVMPLNRGDVLPPRSLFDLVHKMLNGYYKVNTAVVRQTMHVSIPALTPDELKEVGAYISKECQNLPVYKLEKYVGGVVKRSAEFGNSGTFVQFAGTHVTEFDILNLDDAKGSQEEIAAA